MPIKLLPPYDNQDEISPLTKVYLVSVMGCDVHTVDIKDINEFLMLQENDECSCVELEWSPIPDPACPIHGEKEPANVEDTTTP
jgi:hypothetical protein